MTKAIGKADGRADILSAVMQQGDAVVDLECFAQSPEGQALEKAVLADHARLQGITVLTRLQSKIEPGVDAARAAKAGRQLPIRGLETGHRTHWLQPPDMPSPRVVRYA